MLLLSFLKKLSQKKLVTLLPLGIFIWYLLEKMGVTKFYKCYLCYPICYLLLPTHQKHHHCLEILLYFLQGVVSFVVLQKQI